MRLCVLALMGLWLSVAGAQEEIPTAPAIAGEPDEGAALQIVFPRDNEVLDSLPADIFFAVKNIELSEKGYALRVAIDNEPPRTLYSVARPLTPANLADGGHTVRAWLARADGTAVRRPSTYAVTRFFVRKKDFQNFIEHDKPYLTVNLPAGDSYDTDLGGRLCVDVFLGNEHGGGYKVRYSMEGYEGFLDGSRAVYWSDIPVGKHKLRLELLDAAGRAVLGPFNTVERYFEIRQLLKAAPVPAGEG